MQKDHTHHQLHADAPLLHHSDMLPAAALSNFFKAPATPIHNKLPAIHPVKSYRDPQFSNSLNQRSKGLAEVIQMQLIELKKLHGKYAARDMAAMTRSPNQTQNLTRNSTNYGECIFPSVSNQRSLLSRQYNSTMSIIPASKQRTENRDTTTTSAATSKQEQSKASTYTTTSMQISRTCSTPNIQPPNVQNRTEKHTTLPNSSHLKVPVLPPNPLLLKHLEPEKFSAIQKWINSVEEAHEKDGKYLDTIPSQ